MGGGGESKGEEGRRGVEWQRLIKDGVRDRGRGMDNKKEMDVIREENS